MLWKLRYFTYSNLNPGSNKNTLCIANSKGKTTVQQSTKVNNPYQLKVVRLSCYFPVRLSCEERAEGGAREGRDSLGSRRRAAAWARSHGTRRGRRARTSLPQGPRPHYPPITHHRVRSATVIFLNNIFQTRRELH